MESTKGDYRVLNDVDTTKDASPGSSFPRFSQLPLELRLKIWTCCFPSNRFISILINRLMSQLRQQNRQETKPQLYTSKNHLGNLVSGDPYHLTVANFRPWAPRASSANREARQAFLAFYRVAMPLVPDEPGRLRLNPETDILEIQLAQGLARTDALVAFFHDIVASDPKGVGIAHLAMGRNMNDISHLCDQDPSTLHPSAAQALKRLFSQSIQTFYSCIAPGGDPRNMIGQLSYPRAQTTDFALLERDPRPIQTDLAHLAVGVDPRRNVFLWRSLLARYGVPPSSIPVRYLYAVWPYHPHPLTVQISGRGSQTSTAITGREAFMEFLREEDASWAKWMAKINKPLHGERLSEEEHARLGRELLDAAGFWLFGPDTFGTVPEVGSAAMDDRQAHWEPKMVVDLAHAAPELGLFRLDA
ncbi:hypothetical protein PG991_014338 [Apiospora marii]|uniref:2EXR domain-containing protein n=1 Tax=Apiospora marii TaxID=335849 RepID=A0ABR1R9G4_9PEZI